MKRELVSRLWQPVAVGVLRVGDVGIGHRILVERKAGRDLACSIADGRLFRQMYDLCGATRRPILLLEGTDARDPPLVAASWRGAQLALAAGYRVPVLYSSGL